MAGGFGWCPLIVPLGEHLCLEPGLNIATVDMPRLVNGNPFLKIKIEKKYVYIYLGPQMLKFFLSYGLAVFFWSLRVTAPKKKLKSQDCELCGMWNEHTLAGLHFETPIRKTQTRPVNAHEVDNWLRFFFNKLLAFFVFFGYPSNMVWLWPKVNKIAHFFHHLPI